MKLVRKKCHESAQMVDVKNCTPQPGGGTRAKDRLSKEQITKQQADTHQEDTRPPTHSYFKVLVPHVKSNTFNHSGR